ncbi:type III secretion system chaperone [Aureimonas leprariae]|nr:type III secretion system chaperone [Aureimonas leprariae]
MQDVHQAIEALGDAIGLDMAALDANGHMTLTVDEAMPVNFARIDDGAFEMWTPLDDLGSATDASLLSAMLASNHLGEGSGAGRLAMTPDRSGFVFCERVQVAGLDAEALSERLAGFIRFATFWNSAAGREALGRGGSGTALPAEDHGFMIRA